MLKSLFFFFISFIGFNATAQTVNFTFLSNNGTSTLCGASAINFTPVCTGNPIGFTWYFGDGRTSNSAIPSIVFSPGSYTVKLVAVFQNQALEISKTIVVNQNITGSISSNTQNICKFDSVRFTVTSTAINPTYIYNFGDGNIVSNNNNITSHYFSSFGLFNTRVKVISTNGCSDSATINIKVEKFPITAVVNPDTGGCAPINAIFLCDPSLPANSSVSNYAWSFGDGTNTNTTINTTQHIYADSGTFKPVLTITSSQGCISRYDYSEIVFGKPPSIQIAYPSKTTYCGNENAAFVAKSNFGKKFKWEYGDGDKDIVTDTFTFHKYKTLGLKTVKVTPIFNGCLGIPFSFTINIIGVIADYKYINTCTNKKKFTLTNTTQGNQFSSKWIFGDGSADITTTNTLHSYPTVGAFNTMLKVIDNVNGCRDSIEKTIYTANPSIINPTSFYCRNAQTSFTLLNNYTNPAASNIWAVLGQFPSFGFNTYSTTTNEFGDFYNNFAIIDNGEQYCLDTISFKDTISVRGINVDFTTSTSFCTNNNFIITNISSPFSSLDTVTNWSWTFGIPGITSSSYQPLSFVFKNEGLYNLKLIAKDKNGCIDSLAKQILVKESPFLVILPKKETVCLGKTITLAAYHTDSVLWIPASLFNCSTCDTTIATPTASTTIYAKSINAVGCTLTDSMTVKVFSPFTASTTPNTFFACKNKTVQLNGITPTGKKIVWTPNFALNNSNTYTPTATLIVDTSYKIMLTDSAGCYSSSTILNTTLYPPATVNAGPDRILAANSPFTISPTYSADVNKYEWMPAGNLNCTTCPFPSGLADVSQTFIIKANNINGCESKDTVNIFIECAYANLFMASAFSTSITSFNKYYYPQTRGIKKINKFTIYNRFGQVIFNVQNATPNIRNLGWNGKVNGEIPMTAAYVYTLEATCDLGEIITKKGSFLLIR
jgi:PKD repeat protein